MDREYFFELGAYDPGLKIWGGENFELSFKVCISDGQIIRYLDLNRDWIMHGYLIWLKKIWIYLSHDLICGLNKPLIEPLAGKLSIITDVGAALNYVNCSISSTVNCRYDIFK